MPETKYAKSGDVHIAYQVIGDGPFDLVFVPGFVSHMEVGWEDRGLARFWNRLASFSRLILLDKRGTGMSDRVPIAALPTLEDRMDDVRAVMDAVGSEKAVLFGISEGGPMALLFAATYPERTTALVLYGTYARFLYDDDYEWGLTEDSIERFNTQMEKGWGTGVGLRAWAPTMGDDKAFRDWWANFQRQAASPGATIALMKMNFLMDVRSALSSISAPTLVMHTTGDRMVVVENGRYLAQHIPGAKYVEMEGEDHLFWTENGERILAEAQEFLTGGRVAPEPDRALKTVLFTDIVQSTQTAVDLGDSKWRELLEDYYALSDRQVETFRGRQIKTTGDGSLSVFDGPARAIRCALATIDEAKGLGLDVRAGLHAGECEIMGDDIGGIAVHIGSRVSALAGPGEVFVSRTVKDLVAGSGLEFDDRGSHQLKGIPDAWRLFAARSEVGAAFRVSSP